MERGYIGHDFWEETLAKPRCPHIELELWVECLDMQVEKSIVEGSIHKDITEG